MSTERERFRLGIEATAAAAADLAPRLAAGLTLLYAILVVVYAGAGAPVIAAVNGLAGAVLGAISWLIQRSQPRRRRTSLEYGAIGLIVIANVTANFVITGSWMRGIGFLFNQIAFGFFAPTALILALVLAANTAVAVLATWLAGVEVPVADAVIGFVVVTGISGLVFFARVRGNGRLEALRRALRSSHDAVLRELITQSPDLILLVRGGVIVHASHSIAATLRLDSVESIIGAPVSSLTVEGDARLEELLEGELEESRLITLERADGERVVVEVAPPTEIELEQTRATMLVARDRTSSQKALQARLFIADRMTVAGTLAAGVAHEINNPLAYVTMNVGVLEALIESAGGLSEPERRELSEVLADISSGVERMSRIVEDLSAVRSISDDGLRAADPIHALRTAVKVARSQHGHHPRVELALEPVPEILVNEGLLIQALLNVLQNALEAIDPGRPGDHRIRVSSRLEDDEVVIEIRDNGTGMGEATQARMFDPFFTTRPPGRGTGLGMFFCHQVVTDAGGSIEVWSRPGAGTAVTIRLPAATTGDDLSARIPG